jgi:hypothetical protein
MGFFNFSKYKKEERELISIYSQSYVFQGMSEEEAEKAAEDLLDRAIEQSKKVGTYNSLPKNMGDIILGNTKDDDEMVNKYTESIRQEIPIKRKEGVTDKDISLWWNLCDIERWVALELDNETHMSCILSYVQDNSLSMDEAINRLRKYYPLYGDPEDTSNTKGDDRPLPFELKDRVNTYMRKRTSADLNKYKEEVEKSSTFNALVRKEIKTGNL